MEKDFWIWTAALESGFLPMPELERWADRQILLLDRPPMWMLDLSAARSAEEALAALWQAWTRWVASTNPAVNSDHLWGQLYLGFLYLRCESGELNVADLLKQAGGTADLYNCGINCEAFYLLLNEIDGGGPILPSDRPLADRIAERFAPFAELARRHLSRLPVVPHGRAKSATAG